VLFHLLDDRGDLGDRNGEADGCGLGADRGGDADHFAARVDERATAVAEGDAGVGLDVGIEARIEQLAAEVTDDADVTECT
jgi:hypothetical protein